MSMMMNVMIKTQVLRSVQEKIANVAQQILMNKEIYLFILKELKVQKSPQTLNKMKNKFWLKNPVILFRFGSVVENQLYFQYLVLKILN